MCVIPGNVKVTWITDKVNFIGNYAPRNLKEIYNYPAKGQVTNTKRKCSLLGRCPDAVNVNIDPVYNKQLRYNYVYPRNS